MEIFVILFYLFLYVFFSYVQYLLSKKLDVQYSWLAWVPLLSIFNLVKIAGLSYWWILGLFIPLWNIYATIKIYGGISKRTGHGGWWTAWLFFLNPIFLPVTAFHYEKWDETTPRPFTGFKKVLLILSGLILPWFLVIGIFAAALFPSMVGYLNRSRDTARISELKEISTTLMAYQIDTLWFPTVPTSGCVPIKELSKYIMGTWPVDPTKMITPWCDGSDGQTYAYRTGTGSNNQPFAVIGAKLENPKGGNSNLSIDMITPDTILIWWSGKMYYQVNTSF